MSNDRADADRDWMIEALEEEERVEHGFPARKEPLEDAASSNVVSGGEQSKS